MPHPEANPRFFDRPRVLAASKRRTEVTVALPTQQTEQTKPTMTVNDVIAAMKLESPFWEKVPQETRRELIEKLAEERGVLAPQLSAADFKQAAKFLDNHSLGGLYDLVESEETKAKPDGNPDIILALLTDANVAITFPEQEPKKKIFVGETYTKDYLSSDHPILTQEQAQRLFRYKEYGVPLAYLTHDTNFLDSFGDYDTKDRKFMENILNQTNTIEEVIAFCHQRLVFDIVRKFIPPPNLSHQDLMAAGNDGLTKAIETSDPHLGLKLSNIAQFEIFYAIQNVIGRQGYDIPIPRSAIHYSGTVAKFREAFMKIFYREPTKDELRAQLYVHTNMHFSYINTSLDFLDYEKHKRGSLNQKLSDEKDSAERIDFVALDISPVSDLLSDDSFEVDITREATTSLNPNVQRVLASYFASDDRTFAEVAEETDINETEVKQLLIQGLAALRDDPEMQQLKSGRVEPKTERLEPSGEVMVYEQRDEIAAIRKAKLTRAPLETYLTIIDLRKEELTRNEIAKHLGVKERHVRYLIEELLQHQIIEPAQLSFLRKLVELGVLSQQELDERKNLSRNREDYKSKDTELLGAYLATDPTVRLGRIRAGRFDKKE